MESGQHALVTAGGGGDLPHVQVKADTTRIGLRVTHLADFYDLELHSIRTN